MPVPNYRMMGAPKAPAAIKGHGRTLAAAVGQIVTVPAHDGDRMKANGFVFIAWSAPTAARPRPGDGPFDARASTMLWDETLQKLIVFDGRDWRDPSTGNTV